jgi:hypothetical protein
MLCRTLLAKSSFVSTSLPNLTINESLEAVLNPIPTEVKVLPDSLFSRKFTNRYDETLSRFDRVSYPEITHTFIAVASASGCPGLWERRR